MGAIIPEWDGQPLSIDDAFDRILVFSSEYGSPSARLAAHCAVLERLSFETVALMRQNFLYPEDKIRPSLDADVLFGGLCRHLGGEFFDMDKEVRRQLLFSLDTWAARNGSAVAPSRQAARLVRHYVRLVHNTDPRQKLESFQRYLDMLDWVATGFDEPEAAAKALGVSVREELENPVSDAPGVRFSGLAGILRLPLSGHDDLLALAEGVHALRRGDVDRAAQLFGPVHAPPVTIGDLVMPSPSVLHAELHKRTLGGGTAPAEASSTVLKTSTFATPGGVPAASADAASEEDVSPVAEVLRAVIAGDAAALAATLAEEPESWHAMDSDGLTPLHLAAKMGRGDLVSILLDDGVPVDIGSKDQNTPLASAVAYDQLQTAELLIARGANVNWRNRKNTTPISLAAFYGHLDEIDLLLAHGAEINAVNTEGATAVHWAVYQARPKTLRYLIDRGANWPSNRDGEWSLLHMAAAGGDLGVFQSVLGAVDEIDPRLESGATPLHIAAYHGHVAIIERLIELGADPTRADKNGWTPLHYAAQNQGKVISVLLRFDARLETRLAENGYTALHIAVHNNCPEVISILVAAGANVNKSAYGEPALITAALKGYAEALSELLKSDALDMTVTDREGRNVLALALTSKSDEAVAVLWDDPRTERNSMGTGDKASGHPLFDIVEKVEDITLRLRCVRDPRVRLTETQWQDLANRVLVAKTGNAALYDAILVRCPVGGTEQDLEKAVDAGAAWALPVLHQFGLNLTTRDALGRTLLHKAAERSKPDVIDGILALAPSLGIDERDQFAMTPLMLAAQQGDQTTIDRCSKLGADIQACTKEGWTALHLAAQRGAVDICKLLTDAGADIEALTHDRRLTPLAAAIEAGAGTCVAALMRAGASLEAASGDTTGPLVLAVKSGDEATILDVMRALVREGAVHRDAVVDALKVVNDRIQRQHKVWANDEASDLRFARLLADLETGKEPNLTDWSEPTEKKTGKPEEVSSRRETRLWERIHATDQREAISSSGMKTSHLALSVASFRPATAFVGLCTPESALLEPIPWTDLKGSARADIMTSLGSVESVAAAMNHLDATSTQIAAMPVSCYPDGHIIRMADRRAVSAQQPCFFLRTTDQAIHLNGASALIHHLNHTASLKLNRANVLEYLRFFCFFVRSNGWPFLIAEEDWPGLFEAPVPVKSEVVLKPIAHPAKLAWSHAGHFLVETYLIHRDGLFGAKIEIHPNGSVEMVSDQPYADDLEGVLPFTIR